MKALRMAGLAAALALTTISPSQAAEGTMEAPYSAPHDTTWCSAFGLTTSPTVAECVTHADANDAGALSLDLAARSPRAGSLPGSASAGGVAQVSMSHALDQPAQRIVYEVSFMVHHARAASNAFLGDGGFDFHTYAELVAEVSERTCTQCTRGGVAFPLVDDDEFWAPASISNELVTFTVELAADGGDTISTGTIDLVVGVFGDATVGSSLPDRGSSRVEVDTTVIGVRILDIVPAS